MIAAAVSTPMISVCRYSEETPPMKFKIGINILLVVISCVCLAFPGDAAEAPAPAPKISVRDGQHDFDFEIGVWKTHLKRLVHPLSGSAAWVQLDGTTVVRKVWNGRANLAELETDAASGHLQVLSLRLYDPQSRQWSLNTANANVGTVSVPTIGEFK